MESDGLLFARHIQNYTDAKELEPHWGYVSRVIPCTSDPGSCAYLDNVYHAHDLGMMYIGIVWATIGGILICWAMIRFLTQKNVEWVGFSGQVSDKGKSDEELGRHPIHVFHSRMKRLKTAFVAEVRKRLLPDGPRLIFGRTSRLQIVILAMLAGYLFIWSFLGFSWETHVTPVKSNPKYHNIRTTLGPFSDRVGVLAFGMLPFSILLSNRESLLSLLTGIPYHHFNFLHRWLGYIILVQSLLHTIGWTIVEAKLYQPQPSTAQEWISQPYMIWGCVAIILLSLLWILTWPSIIKKTGYEFFKKAHYIMAVIFIGACWGHWAHLKCFLIPTFVLWGFDLFLRLTRTFLMHYNLVEQKDGTLLAGFHSTRSKAQVFEDFDGESIIRLDFDQHQSTSWQIGQHFFLTFPQLSIWQAHPFTPLSFPFLTSEGKARHSYLFRAKAGQTKKLANMIKSEEEQSLNTNVILTGPYGGSISENLSEDENVICIAGGTGITFVLPILVHLAMLSNKNQVQQRKIKLFWVVRYSEDIEWIRPELDQIEKLDNKIEIVTQSTRDLSSTPNSIEKGEIEQFNKKPSNRPNLNEIVQTFLEFNINPTTVIASGPGEMLSELRSIVAKSNSGHRILRGERQANVRLISDNRLEW